MKKVNKLLPIFGICALATATLSLVSCNRKIKDKDPDYVEIEMTWDEYHDDIVKANLKVAFGANCENYPVVYLK